MNDIRDVHPVTGATGMEPNGWMVVGLNANFFSTASQHVVATRLLDRSAEVRFTPIAWHWNYGDGDQRDSSTSGASWHDLHLDEFDATGTSHVYAKAGDYTITVLVTFTAEYRYGDGAWTAIDGTLSVPGRPLDATAATASTVLVGHECGPDSSAPGC